MRIIAGEAKGRRIIAPEGRETRPTSDRVKEALFNILMNELPEASVLDLFAGSGNLSLEALSRGAAHCTMVDSSRESVRIIHKNTEMLKYQNLCEVYENDANSALDALSRRSIRFDIVFLDPPYHKDMIPACIEKISKYSLLEDGGVIAAEHDIRDELSERIGNFELYKRSVYGDTILSFYNMNTL